MSALEIHFPIVPLQYAAAPTCDVTLRGGQLIQKLVFQLLELDGELGVLDDELRLSVLQVGALLVHHQRQQLILKALWV